MNFCKIFAKLFANLFCKFAKLFAKPWLFANPLQNFLQPMLTHIKARSPLFLDKNTRKTPLFGHYDDQARQRVWRGRDECPQLKSKGALASFSE
jgi:hypothetical protein